LLTIEDGVVRVKVGLYGAFDGRQLRSPEAGKRTWPR
jgi:hypothetical protein